MEPSIEKLSLTDELSLMDMPDNVLHLILQSTDPKDILAICMADLNNRLNTVALNAVTTKAATDKTMLLATLVAGHIPALKAILEVHGAKDLYESLTWANNGGSTTLAPDFLEALHPACVTNTALAIAAARQSREFIRAIIPYIVDNPYDKEVEQDAWFLYEATNQSLLNIAIARQWRTTGTALELISKGIGTANNLDSERLGTTPLIVAARAGIVDVVEAAIKAGFDVDDIFTCVHVHRDDIEDDDIEGVEGDRTELSALHCAANNHDVTMVTCLLNNGAGLTDDIVALASRTPVMADCFIDHAAAIGPDLFYATIVKILKPASINGYIETMKHVVNKYDHHLTDEARSYFMLFAADNGKIDIVKFLLDKGYNPNATDRENMHSALGQACDKHRLQVVNALLEAGADVNAATEDGRRPLDLAAEHFHVEVVEVLLESGAEVNTKPDATKQSSAIDRVMKHSGAAAAGSDASYAGRKRVLARTLPIFKLLAAHRGDNDRSRRGELNLIINAAKQRGDRYCEELFKKVLALLE